MHSKKVAVTFAPLSLAGCANHHATTQHRPMPNSTKVAVAGAAVGTVAGGVISHDNRGKGSAIGAVLGGAAGAALGYRSQHQVVQLREAFKDGTATVEKQGEEILIIIPGEVGFASGDAKIRSSFREELDHVVKSLKQFPQTRIKVIGYAMLRAVSKVTQRWRLTALGRSRRT